MLTLLLLLLLLLLLKGEEGGEKRVRLKWLHVYVIILGMVYYGNFPFLTVISFSSLNRIHPLPPAGGIYHRTLVTTVTTHA